MEHGENRFLPSVQNLFIHFLILKFMFEIKAKIGNIDLSMFDLKQLTDNANFSAEALQKHNDDVYCKFQEFVLDFIEKTNLVLAKIGLDDRFKNTNNHIRKDYISNLNGLNCKYDIGHGRASIYLYFETDKISDKLTYDFKGQIIIRKSWNDNFIREEYNLESVSQVFELGADVIKFFIINRDVTDNNARWKLEKELTY
jgi:hypothetical protein